MASVFDYLDWRGDITFSEVGLTEVDSLILSAICYIDFEGIVEGRALGKACDSLECGKELSQGA